MTETVEATTPAPVVDQTPDEFFQTLTGYDEHKIRKAWNGLVVGRVAREDPFTFLRCLVFIHYVRENHPDPKHDALSMTQGTLQAFFRQDTTRTPLQAAHEALAAVLDAGDLDAAKAAARNALEGDGGASTQGEAR